LCILGRNSDKFRLLKAYIKEAQYQYSEMDINTILHTSTYNYAYDIIVYVNIDVRDVKTCYIYVGKN